MTVTVSSGDTGAATVSGPTLRFTPSNWDTEQTVTVRGVNDGDSTDEIVTRPSPPPLHPHGVGR